MEKANDRFGTRTVGELMARDVVTATPQTPLEDLARSFLARRIGGIPVVDADGKPLGIVSKTDIVAAFARGQLIGNGVEDAFDVTFSPTRPALFARDVMKPVLTLREGDAVEHAAELFLAKGVHRAPVVGAAGQVIGMVSAFDLLRIVEQSEQRG